MADVDHALQLTTLYKQKGAIRAKMATTPETSDYTQFNAKFTQSYKVSRNGMTAVCR